MSRQIPYLGFFSLFFDSWWCLAYTAGSLTQGQNTRPECDAPPAVAWFNPIHVMTGRADQQALLASQAGQQQSNKWAPRTNFGVERAFGRWQAHGPKNERYGRESVGSADPEWIWSLGQQRLVQ